MVMFGREMAMNQTCYALKSTTDTPFTLYCRLRWEMDNLVHAAHGSVFDTITTSTFANSKIILPSAALLTAFEQRVAPMFHRILGNTEESQTLAALRDTLLPKLVSGELRTKSERQVNRAPAQSLMSLDRA
jgi:type I restriction enzyme, S subunit